MSKPEFFNDFFRLFRPTYADNDNLRYVFPKNCLKVLSNIDKTPSDDSSKYSLYYLYHVYKVFYRENNPLYTIKYLNGDECNWEYMKDEVNMMLVGINTSLNTELFVSTKKPGVQIEHINEETVNKSVSMIRTFYRKYYDAQYAGQFESKFLYNDKNLRKFSEIVSYIPEVLKNETNMGLAITYVGSKIKKDINNNPTDVFIHLYDFIVKFRFRYIISCCYQFLDLCKQSGGDIKDNVFSEFGENVKRMEAIDSYIDGYNILPDIKVISALNLYFDNDRELFVQRLYYFVYPWYTFFDLSVKRPSLSNFIIIDKDFKFDSYLKDVLCNVRKHAIPKKSTDSVDILGINHSLMTKDMLDAINNCTIDHNSYRENVRRNTEFMCDPYREDFDKDMYALLDKKLDLTRSVWDNIIEFDSGFNNNLHISAEEYYKNLSSCKNRREHIVNAYTELYKLYSNQPSKLTMHYYTDINLFDDLTTGNRSMYIFRGHFGGQVEQNAVVYAIYTYNTFRSILFTILYDKLVKWSEFLESSPRSTDNRILILIHSTLREFLLVMASIDIKRKFDNDAFLDPLKDAMKPIISSFTEMIEDVNDRKLYRDNYEQVVTEVLTLCSRAVNIPHDISKYGVCSIELKNYATVSDDRIIGISENFINLEKSNVNKDRQREEKRVSTQQRERNIMAIQQKEAKRLKIQDRLKVAIQTLENIPAEFKEEENIQEAILQVRTKNSEEDMTKIEKFIKVNSFMAGMSYESSSDDDDGDNNYVELKRNESDTKVKDYNYDDFDNKMLLWVRNVDTDLISLKLIDGDGSTNMFNTFPGKPPLKNTNLFKYYNIFESILKTSCLFASNEIIWRMMNWCNFYKSPSHMSNVVYKYVVWKESGSKSFTNFNKTDINDILTLEFLLIIVNEAFSPLRLEYIPFVMYNRNDKDDVLTNIVAPHPGRTMLYLNPYKHHCISTARYENGVLICEDHDVFSFVKKSGNSNFSFTSYMKVLFNNYVSFTDFFIVFLSYTSKSSYLPIPSINFVLDKWKSDVCKNGFRFDKVNSFQPNNIVETYINNLNETKIKEVMSSVIVPSKNRNINNQKLTHIVKDIRKSISNTMSCPGMYPTITQLGDSGCVVGKDWMRVYLHDEGVREKMFYYISKVMLYYYMSSPWCAGIPKIGNTSKYLGPKGLSKLRTILTDNSFTHIKNVDIYKSFTDVFKSTKDVNLMNATNLVHLVRWLGFDYFKGGNSSKHIEKMLTYMLNSNWVFPFHTRKQARAILKSYTDPRGCILSLSSNVPGSIVAITDKFKDERFISFTIGMDEWWSWIDKLGKNPSAEVIHNHIRVKVYEKTGLVTLPSDYNSKLYRDKLHVQTTIKPLKNMVGGISIKHLSHDIKTVANEVKEITNQIINKSHHMMSTSCPIGTYQMPLNYGSEFKCTTELHWMWHQPLLGESGIKQGMEFLLKNKKSTRYLKDVTTLRRDIKQRFDQWCWDDVQGDRTFTLLINWLGPSCIHDIATNKWEGITKFEHIWLASISYLQADPGFPLFINPIEQQSLAYKYPGHLVITISSSQPGYLSVMCAISSYETFTDSFYLPIIGRYLNIATPNAPVYVNILVRAVTERFYGYPVLTSVDNWSKDIGGCGLSGEDIVDYLEEEIKDKQLANLDMSRSQTTQHHLELLNSSFPTFTKQSEDETKFPSFYDNENNDQKYKTSVDFNSNDLNQAHGLSSYIGVWLQNRYRQFSNTPYNAPISMELLQDTISAFVQGIKITNYTPSDDGNIAMIFHNLQIASVKFENTVFDGALKKKKNTHQKFKSILSHVTKPPTPPLSTTDIGNTFIDLVPPTHPFYNNNPMYRGADPDMMGPNMSEAGDINPVTDYNEMTHDPDYNVSIYSENSIPYSDLDDLVGDLVSNGDDDDSDSEILFESNQGDNQKRGYMNLLNASSIAVPEHHIEVKVDDDDYDDLQRRLNALLDYDSQTNTKPRKRQDPRTSDNRNNTKPRKRQDPRTIDSQHNTKPHSLLKNKYHGQSCNPNSDHKFKAFKIDKDGVIVESCGGTGWIADESTVPSEETIRKMKNRDKNVMTLIDHLKKLSINWCPTINHVIYLWRWLGYECFNKKYIQPLRDMASSLIGELTDSTSEALYKNSSEMINDEINLAERVASINDGGKTCHARIKFISEMMDSGILYPFISDYKAIEQLAYANPGKVICYLSYSVSGSIVMAQNVDGNIIQHEYSVDSLVHPENYTPTRIRLRAFHDFRGGILASSIDMWKMLTSRPGMTIPTCYNSLLDHRHYSYLRVLPERLREQLRLLYRSQQQNLFTEEMEVEMQNIQKLSLTFQAANLTADEMDIFNNIIPIEWDDQASSQDIYKRGKDLYNYFVINRQEEEGRRLMNFSICQVPRYVPLLRRMYAEFTGKTITEVEIEGKTREEMCMILSGNPSVLSMVLTFKIFDVEDAPDNLTDNLGFLDIWSKDQTKLQKIDNFLRIKYATSLDTFLQYNRDIENNRDLLLEKSTLRQRKQAREVVERREYKQEMDALKNFLTRGLYCDGSAPHSICKSSNKKHALMRDVFTGITSRYCINKVRLAPDEDRYIEEMYALLQSYTNIVSPVQIQPARTRSEYCSSIQQYYIILSKQFSLTSWANDTIQEFLQVDNSVELKFISNTFFPNGDVTQPIPFKEYNNIWGTIWQYKSEVAQSTQVDVTHIITAFTYYLLINLSLRWNIIDPFQ